VKLARLVRCSLRLHRISLTSISCLTIVRMSAVDIDSPPHWVLVGHRSG
jgi:hypothetical protein